MQSKHFPASLYSQHKKFRARVEHSTNIIRGSERTQQQLPRSRLIPPLSCARDTPGVGLFVFVEERLDPLCLLELGQLGGVGEAKECGSEFHQPLGIDSGDLAHVLLGGLDHLVEDDPLGLAVKQRAARVN